jgi:hypothetical protein
MKKIIFLMMLFAPSIFVKAQSEKYTKAMNANIAMLDSMMVKNNFAELGNNFARIADVEKTQWLPYYYAGYCIATQGMMEKDNSKKDELANKAADYISKAETILGKENSETDVVKSMIATVRMTVDPQARYMTSIADINGNIEKAKKLDPTNPRPYLLEAQNKFYTPVAFGGGKEVSKPIFENAKNLFEKFKPETPLSPTWGKSSVDYFLSQYK